MDEVVGVSDGICRSTAKFVWSNAYGKALVATIGRISKCLKS